MAKKIKAYSETHQHGIISIECDIPDKSMIGDIGIQISTDGRIWVCINGIAFLRFRPIKKEK